MVLSLRPWQERVNAFLMPDSSGFFASLRMTGDRRNLIFLTRCSGARRMQVLRLRCAQDDDSFVNSERLLSLQLRERLAEDTFEDGWDVAEAAVDVKGAGDAFGR